jgi:hypothetical protein
MAVSLKENIFFVTDQTPRPSLKEFIKCLPMLLVQFDIAKSGCLMATKFQWRGDQEGVQWRRRWQAGPSRGARPRPSGGTTPRSCAPSRSTDNIRTAELSGTAKRGHSRVCQMAYFQTKDPNLGKFWRVLQLKMYIYCHLVYHTGIRYIL